ncbi:ABC transporter permease [Ancylobacter polymorphus]|jgi:ABC-type nitrate/sulfonate/bicarbonate transport system permease component|uniref:ABC-type nitrate/sulfonate/bicarbonate transport system permease component n=1 Tax=Ancylobacter polymorphus TaxID=223390 RepID=A0ABU0BGI0_9HYPH|nr:ABC transporter permease [Ancylobacter polymorphus]MDQ0304953.1 ABC-type nitrate/sulfonate/bicarbonate transport system permease component [Ancylobacter polymorphus]
MLRESYLACERGILGALAMAVFLVAWEGLARGWWADLLQPALGTAANVLRIRPIFLASPSAIAEMAFQMYFVTGEIWPHLGLSAFEFVVGFLIAASIGIPLGLVAGRYRLLSYAVEPLLAALNATPQVALLPLVVLWMGTGLPARIFIIVLLMIVPILINSHAAVRTIDPKWLRLARSFSASEWRLFRTIVLPAAVPFLLAGVRLAIGRGMIGIVVGEIYGSAVGVGVMINQAGSTFQTTRVFVGILTIVVAGLVLSEVVRRIERRVEVWRPSTSADS